VKETLTISEVAQRSGVAASALRFYEEEGLIRSKRTGAGHRRYPRAVIRAQRDLTTRER
jgi:MerR family redox-sensitive transcriptional activator SoxR